MRYVVEYQESPDAASTLAGSSETLRDATRVAEAALFFGRRLAGVATITNTRAAKAWRVTLKRQRRPVHAAVYPVVDGP